MGPRGAWCAARDAWHSVPEHASNLEAPPRLLCRLAFLKGRGRPRRCCLAEVLLRQAKPKRHFPERAMIDVGRRLPPLLSARVGGGGARERRNCELCGHGSRVHVGRDVGSSYRVVYPFPRDATRRKGAHGSREKCVCGTHKTFKLQFKRVSPWCLLEELISSRVMMSRLCTA